MGFRFTLGRILLGLLLITQGISMIQGGYKEQLTRLRDLRAFIQREHSYQGDTAVQLGMLASFLSNQSDSVLSYFIYLQAVLLIVGGALVIANIKLGGLFMAIGMVTLIMSRDNPALALSNFQWRLDFQNSLKDLAVAAMGVIIFTRETVIKHRRVRLNNY